MLIGARQLRDQTVINCNAFKTEMIFFKIVIPISNLFLNILSY